MSGRRLIRDPFGPEKDHETHPHSPHRPAAAIAGRDCCRNGRVGVLGHSLLEEVFDFSRQGAKKLGKGYGLYLNSSPVRSEEWGAIRRSLIEQAGVRGDIEVQDLLGNLRTGLRWYVFDNGRARFLGILPDRALGNPPAEALGVKLNAKAHIYDVRRRQYLGYTDWLRTGILPAEAKLLALLPERIEGRNVSLRN